jgi:transcriptional regulator with XRE-family HTH domain
MAEKKRTRTTEKTVYLGSLGENLRQLRGKLTLQEAATKMGCSIQQIHMMETGKRIPSLAMMQKYASGLVGTVINLKVL